MTSATSHWSHGQQYFENLSSLRVVCVTAALSYLVPKLAGVLIANTSTVWPLWPGCAILVTGLLLVRVNVWPLLIPVSFAGFAIADLQAGVPLSSIVWFIPGNTVEVLISAIGLRYCFDGVPRLNSVRALAKYSFFAIVLAPFAGAFLSAHGIGRDYWTSWKIVFLSEVLAFITLAPALLSWLSEGPGLMRKSRVLHREGVMLIAGLLLVSYVVFTVPESHRSPALLYILVPFLLWSALRFGWLGVSTSLVAVTSLSIWGAVHGRGPFSDLVPLTDPIPLQMFLVSAATPFMILAALAEEHKQSLLVVSESEERLRLAVQAGKMYAYEWDVTRDVVVRSDEAVNILSPIGEASRLTRQQLLARVHPDDKALFAGSASERTPENPDTQISYRVLRPDGSVLWLEKTAHAFFDERGRMVRMIGMVKDITERKLAEEARFRLAAIVESSEDAIASGTLDGMIASWNAGAQKIYGYTEAEAIGKPINMLVPPELPDQENKILETLRAGGRIEQFETVRVTKTGKRINVSLSIFPITDSSGAIVSMAGIARDITERKQAEEALRASEGQLRLAQQAARIGTFERDVRTGRVTWAEGLESLYGLPSGSVHGQTPAFFMDLIHPADRERVAHLSQEALKTGQPSEGEWRAIWPDGSVHWIAGRWQVLMDDSGEPSRVVGVNMDVTERKRTEEALFDLNRMLEAETASLQSSEELLKIFVKHVPAAVAMLDRDMRYVQVSDRWCRDNSVEASAVLGQFREGLPEMPERWKEANRRALQGETLRSEEERWESEGLTRWSRWEVRPWRNADGTVGGIIVFAEDITARKQMEENLSDMSRKLIESQEQERVRIGRELHDDINQQLAMLAVELSQLQENPSELQSRVQELRKQVTEISNDVQALSHDLNSSKLEYLGAVAGIKNWCKEFAERQKLEIDFRSDVPGALPLDIGRALFRVLQESVHNASKHSGVKRVDVRLREELGEIHLIVSDSGRGFDVDAALHSKGLGLTSMRERVRLLNGTIAIDSKPMSGTTIRVRVPIEQEHATRRKAG